MLIIFWESELCCNDAKKFIEEIKIISEYVGGKTMVNDKFIDYLRKYEELKAEIEYLRKKSLYLLEQGDFIECRNVGKEIIYKQELIKIIENCDVTYGK